MDKKSAKEFFRQISTGEVKIDVCDLSSVATEEYKVFTEKLSASDSVIAFGKIAGDIKTAVKIFMATNKNDGIAYEAEIYRFIIDKIISKGLSPNFVPYLGFGVCSLKKLSTVLNDKEFAQYSYRRTYETTQDTVGVLLTGVPEGTVTSLSNFLKKDISDTDISAVFIQICCTLLLMEKFCLVHNDLHKSNILVSEQEEEKVICYNIGKHPVTGDDVFYEVKTRYIAYFFDWDNSYCELVGDNPQLDDWPCLGGGYCNYYSEKRDFYRIFSHIGLTEKRNSVRDFTHGILVHGKSSLYEITFAKFGKNTKYQLTDYELFMLETVGKKYSFNNNKFFRLTAKDFFTVFPTFAKNPIFEGLEYIGFVLVRGEHGFYADFNSPFPITMSKYYPSPAEVLFKTGEWIVENSVLDDMWKDVFEKFLVRKPSEKAEVYVMPEKIGKCKEEEGKSLLENLYEPSVTYLSLREKTPNINVEKLWKYFDERFRGLKKLREYSLLFRISPRTFFSMATLCDVFISQTDDIFHIANCWKVALALQSEKIVDISFLPDAELEPIFLAMRPLGMSFKNIYSETIKTQLISEKTEKILYKDLLALKVYDPDYKTPKTRTPGPPVTTTGALKTQTREKVKKHK